MGTLTWIGGLALCMAGGATVRDNFISGVALSAAGIFIMLGAVR